MDQRELDMIEEKVQAAELDLEEAQTKIQQSEIINNPEANPSKPSLIFTAFEKVVITRDVNGTNITPKSKFTADHEIIGTKITPNLSPIPNLCGIFLT